MINRVLHVLSTMHSIVIIVAADYNDSLVRKAIHALKYQGVKGLQGR